MSLLDILTSPWAIVPDKLRELQAIYATHLRGDKIDLDAIEARIGKPLANDQKQYELQDGTGVAVLQVNGVISPKANLFTRVSGGTTAAMLQKQISSMTADPKVRAAIIEADTPGGNVLGIPAVADAVRMLADAKPTVSVSTGMMASAGYWIGSAANAVYASGVTDMIGSIGVVATHSYDPRSADVQTTEITAGKYKRVASDRAPLSAEGRDYLQSQVDELYRVFVEAVAANRRASVKDVLANMADGKLFIGQQAHAAGLIDGFATVDQLVAQLDANPAAFAKRRRAVFASAALQTTDKGSAPGAVAPLIEGEPVPLAASKPIAGVDTMTPIEQAAAFAAEHPDAAAALRGEGAASERARIQSVRAQSMAGHEELIERLAFDGATSGPEAAVQVLAAERARLGGIAAARAADAPAPVHNAASDAPGQQAVPAARPQHVPEGYVVDPGRVQLHADAQAYIKAHPGTDYLTAVKAVASQLQGA